MHTLARPCRDGFHLRRTRSLIGFAVAVEFRRSFAVNAPLVENLNQTFDGSTRVGQNAKRDGA